MYDVYNHVGVESNLMRCSLCPFLWKGDDGRSAQSWNKSMSRSLMEDQDMQRCEAPANPWFSVKLSIYIYIYVVKVLESKMAQPDSLVKCTLGNFSVCLPAKPLGEKFAAAIQCCCWARSVCPGSWMSKSSCMGRNPPRTFGRWISAATS